jgi:hypothetical protein
MGRGRDAEAQALITAANAQAQAAQISGQAWGGALQGIGNTIAAIPGQMQAQQDRELALEDRDLRRKNLEGSMAYTDARTRELASQDKRRIGNDARAAERDIRISAVMANPERTTADFVRIMGPQDGITFAAGLHKLEDESVELLSPSDRSEHLRGIARAMALLSPELQAEYWPATRARLLSDDRLGLRPEDIPEQPNQAFLDGIRNYDVEPTAPVSPGAPWTGTLDGVPTVFERDPEGRMQPIGGGIGPPLSAPSSLTEDERNRAEYVALKAQGLIPEGQTFPRWLKNEQTLPGVVEPDVRSRLVTNDQGAVNIQDSMRAFNLTPTAEENKLFDRVDAYVTGPLSAPGRFLDNMFGTAPKARATRTALDLAKNSITRAMQNNLRLPEGERVAVLKSIDLETSGWRAAGVVKTKIREIDRTLRMLLQRREEIDDVASLLQAIDELGVPMGSDGFTLAEPEIVIRFDAQGNEMTK